MVNWLLQYLVKEGNRDQSMFSYIFIFRNTVATTPLNLKSPIDHTFWLSNMYYDSEAQVHLTFCSVLYPENYLRACIQIIEKFRLVKTLVYEQSSGDLVGSHSNASTSSNPIAIKNMHILAVTEHHIHSYSMRDSAKIWSCELANMAEEHFASALWVCVI